MANSILDIDLTEDVTLEILEDGEYELSIINVEPKVGNESGKPYLNIRTEVVGEPNADDVYYMLTLPAEGDTEKQIKRKKRRIIAFLEACGEEPGTKLDYVALQGLTFEVILGTDTYEGTKKNVVKDVIVPK